MAFLESNTWADGDNSTCLGGRRVGAYLGKDMRTNSLTRREPLSVLMITHVSKHSVASESGHATSSQGLHEPYAEPLRIEANLDRVRVLQLGSSLVPIERAELGSFLIALQNQQLALGGSSPEGLASAVQLRPWPPSSNSLNSLLVLTGVTLGVLPVVSNTVKGFCSFDVTANPCNAFVVDKP